MTPRSGVACFTNQASQTPRNVHTFKSGMPKYAKMSAVCYQKVQWKKKKRSSIYIHTHIKRDKTSMVWYNVQLLNLGRRCIGAPYNRFNFSRYLEVFIIKCWENNSKKVTDIDDLTQTLNHFCRLLSYNSATKKQKEHKYNHIYS